MKAPSIYIVSRGHVDFTDREHLAWFFDEEEAKDFAEKQNRSEYSWCVVDEVPAVAPMEKRRW
jgi:hypothetical protein